MLASPLIFCDLSAVCVFSFKYESDELEKSVYQDYDSDSDVPEELKQDYVDEQTGDAPLKRSVHIHTVLHNSTLHTAQVYPPVCPPFSLVFYIYGSKWA